MKKLFLHLFVFISFLFTSSVAMADSYLTFTASGGNVTVNYPTKSNSTNSPTLTLYTSTDGGSNWTAWTSGYKTIANGSSLLLKGSNTMMAKSSTYYNYFTMSGAGRLAITGSIMSLLDGTGTSTTIANSYCFYRLFQNCLQIASVGNDVLTASTLSSYCYSYMFSGCTNLTTAPTVGASTLAEYCCSNMFNGCTSLTAAPSLPATTLADYCYQRMFYGCTALTSASTLAATTLSKYCYSEMYSGCILLTTPPALPATALAEYCYYMMFYGCSNLASAPTLSATSLESGCYSYMFCNCAALSSAPSLPATTVASSCYSNMFSGCVSITASPSLPATALASSCYSNMFNGCVSLTTAPDLSSVTSVGSYSLSYMFSGCTKLVTPPNLTATTSIDAYGCQYMFSGCTRLATAPTMTSVNTIGNYGCQYMFQNCTSLATAPNLPATSVGTYGYTSMFAGCTRLTTGPTQISASTIADHTCQNMFSNCSALTAAPSVVATAVGEYGCCRMFQNCTSLTAAPTLSATSLGGYAYNYMFSGCTSLVNGPATIAATTLSVYCCDHMFYNCSQMTSGPSTLPATTLITYCYQSMFEGCSSLQTAPSLPATSITTGTTYCYTRMFANCSSLQTAPTLNANITSNNTYAYNEMFYGCGALNVIEMPNQTTWKSNMCTNWVYGVAATGTFVKHANLTETYDASHIPFGWVLGSAIRYTFKPLSHGTWNGTRANDSIMYNPLSMEPTVIANSGYMFTGWNTASDGSGDALNIASQPGTATTFFAQYATLDNFSDVAWKNDAVVIQTTKVATTARVEVLNSTNYIDNTLASCQLTGDAGVYSLRYYNDMYSAAGSYAIISLKDGTGDLIGKVGIKVPILVTADMNSSALTYNGSDVDIWVGNGATLTLNDNRTFQTAYVAGGGKLVVPSGRTLTTNNIVMRGGDIDGSTYMFRYPQLVANGSIVNASGKVNYEYLLNNSQFYSLCLPYQVNTNAVTYRDGTPAVLYMGVQQYNGLTRTGGTTGWEYLWNPKTMTAPYPNMAAGKGYVVFGVPQKVTMENALSATRRKYCILRFPMTVDLSSGETATNDERSISVTAYGMTNNVLNDGVAANDAGWNLVGNPYLANYSDIDDLVTDGTNGIGLLQLTGSGYIWVGQARYVVLPSDDGQSYEPGDASSTSLPAFKNYFIQIGTGDALTFPLANRAQSAPARMWETDNEIMAGVQLEGNGKKDYVGLLLGDDYTQGYEINADLAKWMNSGLNLYAHVGNYDLSVAALNAVEAEAAIPLTVKTAGAGTYTFSLSDKWNKNRGYLTHLYLYDTNNQLHTDLLTDEYTFTASGNTTMGNRFYLSATRSQLPSAINTLGQDKPFVTGGKGFLKINGITTKTGVNVYSMTGARIYAADITGNVTLPLSQGTYIIRLQNGNNVNTTEGIVY